MALNDYIVASDMFEPDERLSGLSFPCCACIHRHGSADADPCRTCGHNLNAAAPAEPSEF
jgi:hypothetical protein